MSTEPLIRMLSGEPAPQDRRNALIGLSLMLGLSPWWPPEANVFTLGLCATVFGWPGLGLGILVLTGSGLNPLILALGGTLGFLMLQRLRALYFQQRCAAQENRELLKTLVHELRNPLFAAKGTVESVCSRVRQMDNHEIESQLEIAATALQTINSEVDDLTQYFRVEGAGLAPRQSSVRPEDLYQGLRRRHPPEAHPEHHLVWQAEDLQLWADPLLLTQALDKLITNAVIHSRGGEVLIRCYAADGGGVVDIQDQGPGIPEADRQSVFQKEKPANRETSGFGLGLYLAQEYISAQGGSLTLESSERGCLFRIRLPLA